MFVQSELDNFRSIRTVSGGCLYLESLQGTSIDFLYRKVLVHDSRSIRTIPEDVLTFNLLQETPVDS